MTHNLLQLHFQGAEWPLLDSMATRHTNGMQTYRGAFIHTQKINVNINLKNKTKQGTETLSTTGEQPLKLKLEVGEGIRQVRRLERRGFPWQGQGR